MFYGRTYDGLLLDATQQLIRQTPEQPAGRVIAAVVRAKIHARELYADDEENVPGPEDLVSFVVAIAAKELAERPCLLWAS